MRQNIEKRIRDVYSSGQLEQINVDACNFEPLEKLEQTLRTSLAALGAQIESVGYEAGWERVVAIQITLSSASLAFFWDMNNQERAQYLQEQSKPWAQCWLEISSVYPAYKISYELHKLAGNSAKTGSLLGEYPASYDEQPWPAVDDAIRQVCHAAGFSELPDDVLNEKMSFVSGLIESDVEEQYLHLPREICTVDQCLFQGQI